MKDANKAFNKILNQIITGDFANAYLISYFTNNGVELTYWTPEKDIEYKQSGYVTPKLYTQLQGLNDPTPITRDNGPVMRLSGGS
jgi:hypothetical protein